MIVRPDSGQWMDRKILQIAFQRNSIGKKDERPTSNDE
jgi:hypothetical protein